jgi:hypothetical protein
MKKTAVVLLVALAACWGIHHLTAKAADEGGFQTHEFATIRWAGRENTRLIRPNGTVEVLGAILSRLKRPDGMDERTFYMNVAMNAVAKEGYEFAGMTSDEIVMKRSVAR